jgi:hypothetical protein
MVDQVRVGINSQAVAVEVDSTFIILHSLCPHSFTRLQLVFQEVQHRLALLLQPVDMMEMTLEMVVMVVMEVLAVLRKLEQLVVVVVLVLQVMEVLVIMVLVVLAELVLQIQLQELY